MQHNEQQTNLKRTILYYPTITIPTDAWLRQSLLYWDEVSSIVPQSYGSHGSMPYSSDIAYLQSEGQFRPIDPQIIQQSSWRQAAKFQGEFLDTFNSEDFQTMLFSHGTRDLNSRIHRDKLSYETFLILYDHGLAVLDPKDDEWVRFEAITALLYMALLAKHLAAADKSFTLPGTDRPEYEGLLFHAIPSTKRSVSCLNTSFYNLLPFPDENVAFNDILDFKRKREQELLRFRQEIDEFHGSMQKCEDISEIKHISIAFGERVKQGVSDLVTVLEEAKIPIVWGSLKTLIQPNSAALWATILAATNELTKSIPTLPLASSISVIGTAAVIEIGHYLVDEKKKLRGLQKESPFSYVYSATQEGIIQTNEREFHDTRMKHKGIKLRRQNTWG